MPLSCIARREQLHIEYTSNHMYTVVLCITLLCGSLVDLRAVFIRSLENGFTHLLPVPLTDTVLKDIGQSIGS